MSIMDRKATWPGWETVRILGRGSFGAVNGGICGIAAGYVAESWAIRIAMVDRR